jgi:hypothetical protein
MKRPSADIDRPQRRREALKTALVLALIVAVVFAGWQLAVFLRSCAARSRDAGGPAAFHPGPTSQPEWQPSDPAEMLTAPLAAVGLVAMAGDPADVPPPQGARRLSAFQRTVTGQTEQQARYEYAGRVADAAEHYRKALEKQGFELLRDGPDATGRRMLIFHADRAHATVALRKASQNGMMVVGIVFTAASATTPPKTP